MIPLSRTPSPQPPNEPPSNQRQRSFPVDWFFDENAAPISASSMAAVKTIKPKPQEPSKKPLLSPCVQVYKNILNKKEPLS